MEKISPERLAELRASNVPHATASDLTDDPQFAADPAVAAYLHHYAMPKVDDAGNVRPGQPCVCCDNVHSFTWGIAHGQGHCTECGWPATLYHFIRDKDGKEVATIRGVVLWAHPDEVDFMEKRS